MLPCLSKKFLGIPCPGCGGQRSFLYLINGEFAQALMMYPAIYPLLIMGGLIVFNYLSPFVLYGKAVSFFSLISVFAIVINYGIELSTYFNLI